MDSNQDIFARHLNAMQSVFDRFPSLAANHARNYFDRSWSNKGFTDVSLDLWKPVRMKGGKIKERPLVASGRLRRSLRSSPGVVYTDVEYAAVHNDGGRIDTVQSVRAHTRKGRMVKAHSRMVSYTMPKRQFMGPSKALELELEDLAVDLINKALI